jgi:hypothetical protein
MFKRRRLRKIGLALAALAVLGLLAPVAAAGHCYGGNYGYGQSYNYSYGYVPSYYYSAPVQYYPVIQKEVIYKDREVQVPYAKPVYVHKDYYFGLKDYYEDKKRDDVVAEAAAYKALLLGVQLQNAAGQRQGYGYGVQSGAALLPPGGYGATNTESAPGYGSAPAAGGYVPPSGGYAPQAPPQAPPQGYAPQAPPQSVRPHHQAQPEAPPEEPKEGTRSKPKPRAALTDVDPKLQAAVNQGCVRCHNGKPERMDLRNLATLNVGERAYMQALVEDGTMPEGGEPLDNDTAKLFAQHTAKAHKAIKLARK